MNMMKKLFIITCFLLTIMTIHAQAKYCDNDADFVGNKWKEIPNVGIVYKKDGINDYGISFETGNKEADKFLKKSNYYIMWNDTLYINTKRAMQSLGSEAGDGYAKAIVLTDDRFFFLGPPTKSILVVPYGGGAIGGAIGGAMSGLAMGLMRATAPSPCYIYNMLTGSSHVIDIDYMKKLMKNSPDLWKQYKKEKRKVKQDPEVIKEYLRKLGLIEK